MDTKARFNLNTKHEIRLCAIILIVLCALIAIDILTGIFYWNRFHLMLSAENFNNILTPIGSVLAVIVYAITLLVIVKQNKMIQSHHLRPYYEKKIDELIAISKDTPFKLLREEESNYSEYDYMQYIKKEIEILYENKEYTNDLDNYLIRNEKLTLSTIKERSYGLTASKLAILLTGFFKPAIHTKIKSLITEINTVGLSKTDRIQLKMRLKEQLLIEFLIFIESADCNPEYSSIPDISHHKDDMIEFVAMSKTDFRGDYDWFIENIMK